MGVIEIDVMDPAYGAVGDDIADDSDAIEAAIRAAAGYLLEYSCNGLARRDIATIVRFPTPPKRYRVTRTINVSVDTTAPTSVKKMIALVGTAPQGVSIRMDGTDQYIFHVEKTGDGDQATSFERLNLLYGGITYDGGVRRFHAVRDCTFRCYPDWAIKTLGSSVINFDVTRCYFTEGTGSSGGGISIGFDQSDLWKISHCTFVRNKGVDLFIGTTGVHVEDCDFEVRMDTSSNYANPFVHISLGGDVRFINCRFGNEQDVNHRPPRDLVVLGPLSGSSSSAIKDVIFDGCFFRGAQASVPTDTSARTVFRLAAPTQGLKIVNPTVHAYLEFVREHFANTSDANQKPTSNLLSGFTQQAWPRVGSVSGPLAAFSLFAKATDESSASTAEGGRGFDVEPASTRERLTLREVPASRRGGNLLRGTEALDVSPWVRTQVSASQDATGPDGVANSAWTITRTGAGSAHINQQISLAAANRIISGPAVLSIWMRSGTEQFARLEIKVGSITVGGTHTGKYPLTDKWKRYTALIEHVNTGQQLHVYIRHGSDTPESATGSTIEVARPQLEPGDTATAYIPGLSSADVRAERPDQALVLGLNVIATASASPASSGSIERYEVADAVLNTAPAVGGWRGWVCTVAGSPGSWEPFGNVGPAVLADNSSGNSTGFGLVIATTNGTASGDRSLVGASASSTATGENSFVLGCLSSSATGVNSAVAASSWSQSTAESAVALGTRDCEAAASFSAVVASRYSKSSAMDSVVTGSYDSEVSGKRSVLLASTNAELASGDAVAGGYSVATRTSPGTDENLTWRFDNVTGDLYIDGSNSAGPADFAECFENVTTGIIPPGTMVARVGRQVRIATQGDRILGVASASPSYVANAAPLRWHGKYELSPFGARIFEKIQVVSWDAVPSARSAYRGPVAEAPQPIPKDATYLERVVPKQAKNFDPTRKYVPRVQRPHEWTVVGLLGQVRVRVDSTVSTEDFLAAGFNGIGTRAPHETRLEVMEVLSEYEAKLGFGIALCLLR